MNIHLGFFAGLGTISAHSSGQNHNSGWHMYLQVFL